ncbi:uncharacterized protein [Arachis hypogaea]|uniref:uncharacterized protein n=1 Tax=Arachis hypogaea TaxID=3818 RepID=UPI003B226518|nr:uncharacterized protein DS421_15g514760 [Arachis hypogaea]
MYGRARKREFRSRARKREILGWAGSPTTVSSRRLCCRCRLRRSCRHQKGAQAAAGVTAEEGSCISVIPTARSGFVTLGTTAGASGYCCRRRKSWRDRKLSSLPLEVAAGLPLNRFGDRCHFGSAISPLVRVVETVAEVAWNRGFGCWDFDC